MRFAMSFCIGFSPLLWIMAVILCVFWKQMSTEWSRYNALVIASVLVVVIIVNSVLLFLMVS
jgi:hypothetical protein